MGSFFFGIIFIFDNCLTGLAIRPAAVKNATKVSASKLMPSCEPRAKYATSERDTDTRIWILGVAKVPVASNLRF